jgi:hypothetical protein
MSEMITYTGKYVNPLRPLAKDICIEDIAHSLSQICRFGGHCRFSYSVAQHSLLVCDLVGKRIINERRKEIQLWGLLHDAAEAYYGDIISPIKNNPSFYNIFMQTERELNNCICCKLNVNICNVVYEDRLACSTEMSQLMNISREKIVNEFGLPEPMNKKIEKMNSWEVESIFLERYNELKYKKD